ncbi:MAG: hypothetical protein ABH952_07485 [Candidatus Omnitrophota bacterium]
MKKLVIGLIVSLFMAQFAFAGGLNTTFGEVLVENLRLGEPYSMEKEAKVPLIINNTSGYKVDLKIDVLAPEESELKEGYEPIPDINWIEITEKEFIIEPDKSIKTDVIITIPDDKKYLGKKYQVWIWSHTLGRSIGVGLKSRLLLETVENQ